MGDDDSHDSDAQNVYVQYTFKVYKKSNYNVFVVIRDNTSTDKSFARRLGATFVKYSGRRFNSPVDDVLESHKVDVEKL